MFSLGLSEIIATGAFLLGWIPTLTRASILSGAEIALAMTTGKSFLNFGPKAVFVICDPIVTI